VHECSVVEQLVKIARTRAAESGAGKVTAVNIVVGEMTGYMEESLRFYFTLISKDTELDGAELRVTYVKPRLRCEKCGKLFIRERFSFDCPDCHTPGIFTKEGSEFFIDTIEIED
jgi:hydrogenase nickel incorporation protein HypA/HybF